VARNGKKALAIAATLPRSIMAPEVTCVSMFRGHLAQNWIEVTKTYDSLHNGSIDAFVKIQWLVRIRPCELEESRIGQARLWDAGTA
jgi:hypothetical protein